MDPSSDLQTVAVEGLVAENEADIPKGKWDGVDCTFYYGGDQISDAERIDLVQVKYSAANPDKAWTVARLAQATNRAKSNSVIGQLAIAFTGVRDLRPDLVASGNLTLRLVSNQPIDSSVREMLEDESIDDPSSVANRERLQEASGLSDDDFVEFAHTLVFPTKPEDSRFALEEHVLAQISSWSDDDARTAVENLVRFIQRRMLPESRGEPITRNSLLATLGVSDPRAIFPCPSAIEPLREYIQRAEIRSIAERLIDGEQRLCLHGEGGCGKTTAIQEIHALLPEDSEVVVFDCYGGGAYLNSDSYRHRPNDAFRQLSNDLAVRLRIPWLMSQSQSMDYPRAFSSRLVRAAEVVASRRPEALLVIVVDAADSSIIAAGSLPQESGRSFIHDFASLGEIPPNARIVITTRTGRLRSLQLPRAFSLVEIAGFQLEETADHVHWFHEKAPPDWVEDFHYLSGGNPRLQRYALDYGKSEPSQALDYLRPDGKTLDGVFEERLQQAFLKAGSDSEIMAFCSSLISLPRPVPFFHLSQVSGLDEVQIRDLCADLAPGIRLSDERIGFADEDFEAFIRAEGESLLHEIQTRIAEHFVSLHKTDSYSAANLAQALYLTGRAKEVVELAAEEEDLIVIADPVWRRLVHLNRLKTAMRVSREAGDIPNALMTLIEGAKALGTSDAIAQTLIENPALAARFARDTASKTILQDPDLIEQHGPLLFHLMAEEAADGNPILVRELNRQAHAWLERRNDSFRQQEEAHGDMRPRGWELDDESIAAQTEAMLRVGGVQPALRSLSRWRPRHLAARVATLLSQKLIASGQAELLHECLSDGGISTPWDFLLITPLGLAGDNVELSRLETSLSTLLRRGLIRPDRLRESWQSENYAADFLDKVITSCELVIARGGDRSRIIPVLETIADPELRRVDHLSIPHGALIDFTLRASSLLERFANRDLTLDKYLVPVPESETEPSSDEERNLRRRNAENKSELERLIGPLVGIYNSRSRILSESISSESFVADMKAAISDFRHDEYRFRSAPFGSELHRRAALSVSYLLIIPKLDKDVIFDQTFSLLGSLVDPFGSEGSKVLDILALEDSLHNLIVESVTRRSSEVLTLQVSADSKIGALVKFARNLASISPRHAMEIFNDAIEVAREVDVEVVHEITMSAALAESADSGIDASDRRAAARDLSIVIADAGVRLEGYDHFPWYDAAKAVATLDTCIALAASSRWDDSGIASLDTCLDAVLSHAVSRGKLAATQITALLPLLEVLELNSFQAILDAATSLDNEQALARLAEQLASDELMRFGEGMRPAVFEKLSSLAEADGKSPSFWLNCLRNATEFHSDLQKPRQPGQFQAQPQTADKSGDIVAMDILMAIDIEQYDLRSPESIHELTMDVLDYADKKEVYLPVSSILEWASKAVPLKMRADHIEALSRITSSRIGDHEVAEAIEARVGDWREESSVELWCRTRLLHVIVDRLPGFTRWLELGQTQFPSLLSNTGELASQIVINLLEAIEKHADELRAHTVYALVGIVAQFATPNEMAIVITEFARRRVGRIPESLRDNWILEDIPNVPIEGVARLLFALMGDIDIRTRWRAAHAVRRLASLGENQTLDELAKLYGRKAELSFRKPDAPFYWLAAQLWLVMAMDRIASENPSVLSNQGHMLMDIAVGEDLPHIVLRSFAKSAVRKLTENGNVVLSADQIETLNHANSSPVARMRVQRGSPTGFDRFGYGERENRRFRFDMIDTLPYWYEGALRLFADLEGERFLDTAEHWIVDQWGVTENPWRWDDDPRKNRFGSGLSPGSRHDHGSRPTLERYDTYLEWHAMCCAIGQLLQEHALSDYQDDDDYFTLEAWLERECLMNPPLWLADLRGPKPLEEKLWFQPSEDFQEWIEGTGDDDYFSELNLFSEAAPLVVASYHTTRSQDFIQQVRVDSALVSSSTAASLVRALQTVDDSWDYSIPAAGSEQEIHIPPYELQGWLTYDEIHGGIDEGDPLRFDISGIGRAPSTQTFEHLNLQLSYEDVVRWVDAKSGARVFAHENWSDSKWDQREGSYRYYDKTVSDGWRLNIDRQSLFGFLNRAEQDLIIEIEITRRNKDYEYSRYDEEKRKEAKFDRVVLLRRDGTIEDAEGRLGSWASFGKRTGVRG